MGQRTPHTALVYSDWRNRNELIDSLLRGITARWRGATILSALPEVDAKFFGRRARSEGPRQRHSRQVIYDAAEFATRTDPSDDVLSIWRDALRSSGGSSPPIMIADWAHLCYDRFETIMKVERMLEAESISPICCYNVEGFCSLDPKHIIGVLETHGRTLFGSTIFERAN